jgi:subtilisin family serine protease
MAQNRVRVHSLLSRYSVRKALSDRRAARTRLRYELLEPRHLLAAEIGFLQSSAVEQQSVSTASITWFETVVGVERVPLASLASVDRLLPEGVVGPIPLAVGEWIVQLRADAASSIRKLADAALLLDDINNDFTVLSGLGSFGSILVQARGASQTDIESSLAKNAKVESFGLNQLLQGQAVFPNDPDFSNMTGLHNVGQFGATVDADVDAPEAWELTQGSTSVVVGVIDSGIDVTHPDLYLNIWINQGEIPVALRSSLIDTDGDGLITFYDLNHESNRPLVRDLNGNGYIDAIDLLLDPAWADGQDTDGNGFIDDFFGWNFRSDAKEPFAPNNPSDALGHGTHVAGTIGAIGNNSRGVTGLNWRSSLMSLKFLDENNQGDTAAAIAAINYANMMRLRFDTQVRVMNNSWGQPGGVNLAFQNAIRSSGESGILFVAAAGNGNILGQGVDNDRTPFYPASFEIDNVIAVGASDGSDRLASFSNFGLQSVDIVAPGVGIRSTLPGGRYGEANGTSMATPHVAGVAALVWALQPEATAAEVRRAILEKGDAISSLGSQINTGRRLNAFNSLVADVFAPTVELLRADNVSVAGGTEQLITVIYRNRLGVDLASLGNSDLIVTRQAAVDETFGTTFVSATENASKTEVTAVYRLAAIGGTWDANDYGNYVITAKRDAARSLSGLASLEATIGSFEVKIAAPGIFYVNSFADSIDANPGDGVAVDSLGRTTLRAAIQEANALAPAPVKIFLQSGTYPLTLNPIIDPGVVFPAPGVGSGYEAPPGLSWSNGSTGDLDMRGNITLTGLGVNRTIIDAQGIDRVMKVYAGAVVNLSGLTLTGGNAPPNHSGGAILTSGELSLELVTIRSNRANAGPSSLGGGIAQWAGSISAERTLFQNNVAVGGGGIFITNESTAIINASSFVENSADGTNYLQRYQLGGGGFLTSLAGRVDVTNSTFSDNIAAGTAIGAAVHNLAPLFATGDSAESPSISNDSRFIAFSTTANLLPNDYTLHDIYLYDSIEDTYELLSVSTEGVKADAEVFPAVLSSDGRYVAFRSSARTLDDRDGKGHMQIFWRDRLLGITKMVSVSSDGIPGNDSSLWLDISSDGQFVVFNSYASNLVNNDFNGLEDIFVYHVQTGVTERVSISNSIPGSKGGGHFATISGDGRYVAFASIATDLVAEEQNLGSNIFLRDLATDTIRLISRSIDGGPANNQSSIPSISDDGQVIAFHSYATNLISEQTTGFANIYTHSMPQNTNTLITRGYDGTASNGNSLLPVLSPGGRYLAFVSEASNLVPDDTNGVADLFIFDRLLETMHQVPTGSQGINRDGLVNISDAGPTVVFTSTESLAPGGIGTRDSYQYNL